MLYSIIPDEEIWAETDEVGIYELYINGCMMQVASMDGKSGVIIRILSTDPQDYLNPKYQPGTSIPFIQD